MDARVLICDDDRGGFAPPVFFVDVFPFYSPLLDKDMFEQGWVNLGEEPALQRE